MSIIPENQGYSPKRPTVLWKSFRRWLSENPNGEPGGCQVYLLEDRTLERERTKQALCACAPGEYTIREFSDSSSLLAALEERLPDALLVSLSLSGGGGLDAMRKLTQLGGRAPCPVVALSETVDDRTVAAALRAGAHDVVPRERLGGPLLGRAIQFACDSFRLHMDLETRRRELEVLNRELREKRGLLHTSGGSVSGDPRRTRTGTELSSLAARVVRTLAGASR